MLVKSSTEGGLGNPETRFLSPGGEFFNTRFSSRPVKKPRLVTNGFRTEETGVTTNDDDRTSTSGDEGLFMIQVRSPTSKQRLHGQIHADGNNNNDNNSSLSVEDPKHELCSHGDEGDVAGHGVPASFVGKSDTGWEGEGAAMNVYVRKRKRSSDSVPVQEHGFSQSEDVIKHYVRRRRQIEEPSQHVKVNEVALQDEQHGADISTQQVEEGNLNVFQRRSKKTPAGDSIDEVESEGIVKVFRRRSLPDADQISARAETKESNVNVFQRRSKMTNPVSHAENIARVGPLHVSHRRSMKNQQLPEVEDSHARGENLNVFQRRSKMIHQVSQAEHHGDVKAKNHDVDVEGEVGNFHVFKRRAKVHPENPENHVGETGGSLNVFQRRSKMNPKKKSDELEKGLLVSEKLGYVPADHQPGWLPQGWTLEVTTAAKPRDKYYHHTQSGRIFRSKHEVLQILADGTVVGAARSEVMVSDGSGIKKLPPPVAGAHVTKSSGDGTQLPHDGSPAKSPSDQENRGKLILRLKRKQPDSDGGGKGRPKRPMYEVIHGEKPSSSTSTPTKPAQETTPASPHSLSGNAIQQQTKPLSDHAPSQEQEPHTALGIPATSYNTNHTHVCMPPTSWHTFTNVNAPEAGGEVHKALKASRAIPKLDHTKLFLDLGRRLCLAGVEQRPRR